MDKDIQIQLGSTKNVDSVNVDTYDKIVLDNQRNEIIEYNIRNILNISDVFENERQNTQIYRIYGGIEYLSILNGLSKNNLNLENYFKEKSYFDYFKNNVKNIHNSFDFYLLRPIEYKHLSDTKNEYIIRFEVIATPENFDIFEIGYSRNIFNEPKYSFILNNEFDITNWVDGFGFPITEFYIYPQYKLDDNETMKKTVWSDNGNETESSYTPNNLNIGDIIDGNKINYYKSQYSQVLNSPQKLYIKTYYEHDDIDNGYLQWKYESFIPLKLRYLSNDLSKANTGNTQYDETSEIPDYATHLHNGNMVWREILEQGYIDPLTGEGVDYPFVNKRRYLFSNININIIPDLDHTNTNEIFNEIKFNEPTSLNKTPTDNNNLNNIGKPC